MDWLLDVVAWLVFGVDKRGSLERRRGEAEERKLEDGGKIYMDVDCYSTVAWM